MDKGSLYTKRVGLNAETLASLIILKCWLRQDDGDATIALDG